MIEGKLQFSFKENILFGRALRRINTVKEILRLSSFTSGGRPQVPLRVIFHAQKGQLCRTTNVP